MPPQQRQVDDLVDEPTTRTADPAEHEKLENLDKFAEAGAPPPFRMVNFLHAHPERKKAILDAHPEIETLYGYDFRTTLLTITLVVINLSMAAYMGTHWNQVPAWAFALVMYCIGAPINHAMSMVIHDACHDLCAPTQVANKWVGIIANLPLGVPSAMSFRRYHLEHHSHMGVVGTDLDLPPDFERAMVQHSTWRKIGWIFVYAASYGLRPLGWARTKLASEWEGCNMIVQMSLNAAMVYFFGWHAMLYMLVSTLFSFGLHPVAAHFLSEHFTLGHSTHELGQKQETFSYYGRLNPIILNVGYHNEHHDFSRVPWTRLPQVKAMAPEFYEPLFAHKSYWYTLKTFFFDQTKGPHSRIARTLDTHRATVKQLMADRKASRLGATKLD
jgi:sphingolipid delta-4 desaturase